MATILWGNRVANVLRRPLSHSVLAGISGFLFSAFVITMRCEVVPQGYFFRDALHIAARPSLVLKVYSVVVFPVAKPTALLLDRRLRPEIFPYFRERDFRRLIARHVGADMTEVGAIEGTGALKFLDLVDVPISQEGEPLDPRSVLHYPRASARSLP